MDGPGEVAVGHVILAGAPDDRLAFDSLGNIVESHDDLEAFWDRSLGVQAMNGAKPYQLQFATNAPFTPPDTRRGWLDAQYDEARNLTAMLVRRTAVGPISGSKDEVAAVIVSELAKLFERTPRP
jgi:hypothetical protein